MLIFHSMKCFTQKIVSGQSKNPKTISVFTLFKITLKTLPPTYNRGKNIATAANTHEYTICTGISFYTASKSQKISQNLISFIIYARLALTFPQCSDSNNLGAMNPAQFQLRSTKHNPSRSIMHQFLRALYGTCAYILLRI